MTVTTKIQPIDQDIKLLVSDLLSDVAQSAAIAEFAQGALDEALAIDTAALGEAPDYVTIVDGRVGVPLDSVRPDGTIVFQFDIITQVVTWIEYQLITHSPVRTGRYQQSHRIYIDGGEEFDGKKVPQDAREIVFAPTVPYARLIEPHGNRPGESKQAPDGVYQAVAELARRQFGGVRISFGYRSVAGIQESAPERRARPGAPRDLRQPAIIIEV
jgi:hypothetical protein